jgi:hypothetical protein
LPFGIVSVELTSYALSPGKFDAPDGNYFRQYVVNPQKIKPDVAMPAHPTFDAATLDALQAYFKTMLSGN